MSSLADAEPLAAEYFDGRSARAHAVLLRLQAHELSITGDGIALHVPAAKVRWPERTRHGPRVSQLPDGGSLHCHDAQAWDRFVQAAGRAEPLVVRAQQSWRWASGSVLALAVLASALYAWGIPWIGRVAVAAMPMGVDSALGDSALRALDESLLRPSTLPAAQQQRLQQALSRAVAGLPAASVPPHRLLFRSGRLGPNAFALPGGTLVLTDALVEWVQGDEAVIVGVLGHELGHVQHRHGLRLLVQAGAVAAVASVVLGDFSGLLAGVPALLGQAAYSRDAEREADVHAVTVMKAAGISPAVLAGFFEKVAARQADGPPHGAASTPGRRDGSVSPSALGIAISSHPADEERIRFFREAGTR